MAWTYCKCGHGMQYPTIEEIANQAQECPECGRENNPQVSIPELLIQLNERIEKLENKID